MINLFKKSSPQKCIRLSDLISVGTSNISNSKLRSYYEQVAPLADAIDMIVGAASQITPFLQNQEENQFIRSGDILDLLKNPNADKTYDEFAGTSLLNLLLFGNSYILATGVDSQRPPKELFCINPALVSPVQDNSNYYPDRYIVTESNQSTSYERTETSFGVQYLASNGNELWHIKRLTSNTNQITGDSAALAIRSELEQYLRSGLHNTSLLKNGFNANTIVFLKDDLSQDEYERICQNIRNWYSGQDNAGRAFVSNGIEKIESLALTSKDMDFLKLRIKNEQTIYSKLNIPLPLVTPENMTLANMETAQFWFYDGAVLPVLKKFLAELTLFLGKRFDLDGLRLWYDENEIGPIIIRKTEVALNQSKIGVLTINEIRASLGYEPLDGGDVLLGPAASVPVAQDVFTEDEPKPDKKLFMKLMKQQGLSDEELEEIALSEGL